jgi:predicted PurR-regulated permease PerM
MATLGCAREPNGALDVFLPPSCDVIVPAPGYPRFLEIVQPGGRRVVDAPMVDDGGRSAGRPSLRNARQGYAARPERIAMTSDRNTSPLLALCTAIVVLAALYLAAPIAEPVAFGLFAVALAWPLQKALHRRLPTLLALGITLVVCAAILGSLGSAIVWCLTRAVQYLGANADRFQVLYQQKADWLGRHDVFLGSLALEHFDVPWVIALLKGLLLRLQGILSFLVVTLIFAMLGLLEVDATRRKLLAPTSGEAGRILVEAATQTAAKLRRYMLVRTGMSVLTGAAVWAFARATGLELALEWGLIAFVLNYVPFIGPLVATLLPTLLAIAHFASVPMALVVFACLNVIQFIIGSYIEPRMAGATLSLSPFLVLFAVFFGSFLWGISGAFIGVPLLIAATTLCRCSPRSAWVADLLSGEARSPGA